jgi:putative sugar O-methyltransferase
MSDKSNENWLTVSKSGVTNYLDKLKFFAQPDNFVDFRAISDWAIWEDGSSRVGEVSLKKIHAKRFENEFYSNITKIKKNDLIGNPTLHNFKNLQALSSSSIQYALDALSIKRLVLKSFENDLKQISVIEIGAGFGGLCRILSEFIPIQSYTIIDLPEALEIQKMYLKNYSEIFNKTIFINALDGEKVARLNDPDLVISCAALAELSRETQLDYNNQIIHKSQLAYISYNTLFRDDSRKIFFTLLKSWSKNYRISSWVGLQGTYLEMSKSENSIHRYAHNFFRLSTNPGFRLKIFAQRASGWLKYRALHKFRIR